MRINSPLDFAAIRQRYQKALLTWLQAPEEGGGLRQMRAILGAVALAHPPELAPFWRDAEALLLALVEDRLQVDVHLRKLAGRIDFQLRLLANGHAEPDPLLWGDLQTVLERLTPPPVPEPEPLAPLAASLAQTASILPFMAQPTTARFDDDAVKVWNAASATLCKTWGERFTESWTPFRTAIFGLCGAALKMNDPAFLRLSEALASATDRVDDEAPQPPGSLVAAIAAAIECMETPDFLNHAALYSRLDQFSSRLEKAAVDELLVQQARQPAPPLVTEVRLPQPSSPIFNYLQSLKERADEQGPVTVDVPLQPMSVKDFGLPVEDIAPAPTSREVRGDPPPSATLVRLFEDDADEKIEDMRSALEVVPPEGALLARVARDLEQLADSLSLSGLAQQANRLAVLVDRMGGQLLDQESVRDDLLSVIQYMQDQVGAVAMGMPPHANPRITELMATLEARVPEVGVLRADHP